MRLPRRSLLVGVFAAAACTPQPKTSDVRRRHRRYEPATFPADSDVAWVAREGEDVSDLSAHRVTGKVTVFEFGAAWCLPCHVVDEHMARLLPARSDVAYRKLDIGDWGSPLARHYLGPVATLPFVLVYGKDGAKIDAFARLDLERLDRAIARGLA